MNFSRWIVLVYFGLLFCNYGFSNEGSSSLSNPDSIPADVLNGLKFRSIGPAMTSGRIADFAIHPDDHRVYYVGVASGNIWKTTNAGTTFEPVFENYGSYAIGSLAMDPNNPNVVWAGTGENNHQRALGYGDGIYKTIDGGKSWKNMGLKASRHIGMIAIDPKNTDIVFVAAEGSAWGPGGDRGLYKTTDGGETWNRVLYVSENTGINNVIIDPRYSNIIYASSEQRRRHVHTKIGGGPETTIYKSTDGGENWRKIDNGLPKVHMGGMGIALSPANPDVLYVIIEAQVDAHGKDQSGFYRSTNRGESWTRMSDHHSSGQYYNEIYCDPKDVDKVYSVETISHYTEDGGKTFKKLNRKNRHVDDHALWIDPGNTGHLIIGGDGGIYESYDAGNSWDFRTNLPITQFYRVAVDNDYPFYNVYGGTQDNNTLGGPSQTKSRKGITSEDWFPTLGGDGFWPAIDPENPDIVYSEYQYGNLYRIDKKSGERLYIKPMPEKGEYTFKWNWNTPFMISPHSKTRLYIAANVVFRSDDRGNSWKRISDDLTTGTDRNAWPVMDRYWSADAVKKDVSTSLFGTIVSMDESPVKENLVYIGTDDGVIQVTEDAAIWKKSKSFPEVPEHTYISDIRASKHDENVVFATFDNRKRDDFTPYVLKSTDKGKTWQSISANLPGNHTVHTIQQDHVDPDLLFVGTEFGVFYTNNGGLSWTKMGSGLPTISVRDMEIQKRENDLVLATFGRGIYILDDYSVLREIDKTFLEKDAHLFGVKDALMYMQTSGKYGQGSTFFSAPNPPFGAIFTYYLQEEPKTKRQERWEKEKELFEGKVPVPQPEREVIREEEREDKPYLLFTVTDNNGRTIRKLKAPAKKGINRVNWDLRYPDFEPVKSAKEKTGDDKEFASGFFTMPGKYQVSLSLVEKGQIKKVAAPVSFKTALLADKTIPARDKGELISFQEEIGALGRDVQGCYAFVSDLNKKIEILKRAAVEAPTETSDVIGRIYEMEKKLDSIDFELRGTVSKASAEEVPPEPVSILDRMNYLLRRQWSSTADPTQTERMNLKILKEDFPALLNEVNRIDQEIKQLENELEKKQAPWTPGRIPE